MRVYGSEAELLAAAEGDRPDLVLVSAISPKSLDVQLLQRLTKALPDVPFALHVDLAGGTLDKGVLIPGVKGVIPTTSSPRLAAAALQLIAAGGTYLPDEPGGSAVPMQAGSDLAVPSRLAARLTERQRDVLRLAREGKTNKQIARELGLTQNTVKVHIGRLMRRLGVANRVGLALVAARVLAGP